MIAALTLVPGRPSPAALPPGAVDDLKALAPEVLDIEITGAEAGRPEHGRIPMLYRATVRAVLRSTESLSPGEAIEIDTFAPSGEVTRVGPLLPPRLSPGWRGRVWLKPLPPTAGHRGIHRFLPAAYGHGFEAAE